LVSEVLASASSGVLGGLDGVLVEVAVAIATCTCSLFQLIPFW
jgi:hypothetical protein